MEILDYEDLNAFIKAFKQRDESSCQHYIEKIYRYYKRNSRDLLLMDREESEKVGYAFAIMALAYEWKDEIDKVVAENAFFILSHGYCKHNDPYVLPALFSLIEFDAQNLIDITTKVLMQFKRAGIPSSIPDNLVFMGDPIGDKSWMQFRSDSMRILTPIKCYIIDQIYDIKENKYRDLSMSFSHVQLSPLGTKGFWKAIESCQTMPHEVFLNICSIGKTNMDCMYNEIKRQINLHIESQKNKEHTEPFITIQKEQISFSLQELQDKYGRVSVGHQTILRPDGSESVVYGLKFGKGDKCCFARFSSRMANDDQKLRDPSFQRLNGVEIGQKIWEQKDDFMVVHKRNSRTGNLMYHQNGEPVLVVYHKSDV